MKYHQPVFRLNSWYTEQCAPNIYKTKEEAEMYLDEMEDILGTLMYDRYVKELEVCDK